MQIFVQYSPILFKKPSKSAIGILFFTNCLAVIKPGCSLFADFAYASRNYQRSTRWPDPTRLVPPCFPTRLVPPCFKKAINKSSRSFLRSTENSFNCRNLISGYGLERGVENENTDGKVNFAGIDQHFSPRCSTES
jgi:hypothetical protein